MGKSNKKVDVDELKEESEVQENKDEEKIDRIDEKKDVVKEISDEKTSKESASDDKKKTFTIFGLTPARIIAYFIIYSMLGFIIETLFGLLTKGVIESRKSFLYGPFCGIYGLGAVVMIATLRKRFDKNNFTLFIGGFIVGSIIEYAVSLIGEEIFHIKWWDYSTIPFNVNGRICLIFSFFWGALGIFLMSYVNPKIDRLIDKITSNINPKFLNKLALVLAIILFLDLLTTSFALKMFFVRLVNDYDLQLQNVDEYLEEFTDLYNNPIIKKIVDKYFSYDKMLKTFPNVKVTSKDGHIILICDILKDIQPYYVRVFTPKLP